MVINHEPGSLALQECGLIANQTIAGYRDHYNYLELKIPLTLSPYSAAVSPFQFTVIYVTHKIKETRI